ncbi:hypothetical protein V8E53_002672 [Lactarius tabidus]
MAEFTREDEKVVQVWWRLSAEPIHHNGFILDKYHPTVSTLPDLRSSRSFGAIVASGPTISTTAKHVTDKRSVKLTVVRDAINEENVQEQNVIYFDVYQHGVHTLMVTPITAPSRRLPVPRLPRFKLPRLSRSPLHRIEESDALESESLFSTDSSLASFGNLNTSGILDVLTDFPPEIETSDSANTLLIDPQLETPNSANTSFPSSFISTDPSVQSYHTANASFISTDSSLQSYYTANSSFISTDSLLQSYYTADTSSIVAFL